MRSRTKGWQKGWKERGNSGVHVTRWILTWRLVVTGGRGKGGVSDDLDGSTLTGCLGLLHTREWRNWMGKSLAEGEW